MVTRRSTPCPRVYINWGTNQDVIMFHGIALWSRYQTCWVWSLAVWILKVKTHTCLSSIWYMFHINQTNTIVGASSSRLEKKPGTESNLIASRMVTFSLDTYFKLVVSFTAAISVVFTHVMSTTWWHLVHSPLCR